MTNTKISKEEFTTALDELVEKQVNDYIKKYENKSFLGKGIEQLKLNLIYHTPNFLQLNVIAGTLGYLSGGTEQASEYMKQISLISLPIIGASMGFTTCLRLWLQKERISKENSQEFKKKVKRQYENKIKLNDHTDKTIDFIAIPIGIGLQTGFYIGTSYVMEKIGNIDISQGAVLAIATIYGLTNWFLNAHAGRIYESQIIEGVKKKQRQSVMP